MNNISDILKWIRSHLGHFFLLVLSSLVFLFLLFPFDDLSDFVTSQIAKVTGGRVFLQFDHFSVSPLGPKAEFDRVVVEAQGLPSIRTQFLSIAPSFTSILNKQPHGTIEARGFLKGDVELKFKGGAKTEKGEPRHTIELSASKISLKEIKDLANLPLPLKGQIHLQASSLTDLTFVEQPEAELTLVIDQFELPGGNITTAMAGSLNVPEIKFKQLELKGRLTGGRFFIDSGKLGDAKDELNGTIKGDMQLQLLNMNNTIVPQFGAYNFSVDLKAKKSFQEKANLFLVFIDSYKANTTDGAQYKFKLSGTSFYGPPNISSMQ